jgi:hypothetical protein
MIYQIIGIAMIASIVFLFLETPYSGGVGSVNTTNYYNDSYYNITGETTTSLPASNITNGTFGSNYGYGTYIFSNNVTVKNLNNGTSDTSNMIVTSNVGTSTNYFVKTGITSNNYNQAEFSSMLANDSYMYNKGGNLIIGTGTAGKYIKLIAGGTGAGNETVRISYRKVNITGFATYWSSYGEMYMEGELEDRWTQTFVADRWECITAPVWEKSDMTQFVAEGGNLAGDHNAVGVYRIEWAISSSGQDLETKFGVSLNGEDPRRDCILQTILTGQYGIQSGTCLLRLADGDKLCLMAYPEGYNEDITFKYGNFNANYIGD